MSVHNLAVERPKQVVIGVLVAKIKLPVVSVYPATIFTILERRSSHGSSSRTKNKNGSINAPFQLQRLARFFGQIARCDRLE
jgi:hypothetical protein